jgi:5-(carboxyamino)imidazole ribonucleotide mutase
MTTPLVSIIMGSNSDLPIMKEAAEVLNEHKIPFEINIVSAHRTPDRMVEFAKNAHLQGIKVIIAGAGGAAHLPGMVASITPLPVIGVPIKSSNSIDGWDSLLSIIQMPNGVPVASVSVNGAKSAGLLAVKMLAAGDEQLYEWLNKSK